MNLEPFVAVAVEPAMETNNMSIMDSEPVIAVEVVRTVLRVLLAAGVAISVDLQTSIIALVTVLVTAASMAYAAYSRSKVYAPDTVRDLVAAARSHRPPPMDPPVPGPQFPAVPPTPAA